MAFPFFFLPAHERWCLRVRVGLGWAIDRPRRGSLSFWLAKYCHCATLNRAMIRLRGGVVCCFRQRASSHCAQCLGAPLWANKDKKKMCGIAHLLLGTIKREGSTHVGWMEVALKVNLVDDMWKTTGKKDEMKAGYL